MIDWTAICRSLLPPTAHPQMPSVGKLPTCKIWSYISSRLLVEVNFTGNVLDIYLSSKNGRIADMIVFNDTINKVKYCGFSWEHHTIRGVQPTGTQPTGTQPTTVNCEFYTDCDTYDEPDIQLLLQVITTRTIEYLTLRSQRGKLNLIQTHVQSKLSHDVYYLIPDGYIRATRTDITHPIHGTIQTGFNDFSDYVNEYGMIYMDDHGYYNAISWTMGLISSQSSLSQELTHTGKHLMIGDIRSSTVDVYDYTTKSHLHTFNLNQLTRPLGFNIDDGLLIYQARTDIYATTIENEQRVRVVGIGTLLWVQNQWIADDSILVIQNSSYKVEL